MELLMRNKVFDAEIFLSSGRTHVITVFISYITGENKHYEELNTFSQGIKLEDGLKTGAAEFDKLAQSRTSEIKKKFPVESEIKSDQTTPDPVKPQDELCKSGQHMQDRIVELSDKVGNEKISEGLLKLNDELNNLFLRYERFGEKQATVKQESIVKAVEEPKPLIGLEDNSSDVLRKKLENLDLNTSSPGLKLDDGVETGAAEFDNLLAKKVSSEIKSDQTIADAVKPQDELCKTCQIIQGRIVEQQDKVGNEKFTEDWVQENDELNNLLLRQERFEKKRTAVKQESVVKEVEEPEPLKGLEDNSSSVLNLNTSSPGIKLDAGLESGAAEFVMLAQSRTLGIKKKIPVAREIKFDQTTPDAVKPKDVKIQKEQDFHEMERRLQDQPEMLEEGVLSGAVKRYNSIKKIWTRKKKRSKS